MVQAVHFSRGVVLAFRAMGRGERETSIFIRRERGIKVQEGHVRRAICPKGTK